MYRQHSVCLEIKSISNRSSEISPETLRRVQFRVGKKNFVRPGSVQYRANRPGNASYGLLLERHTREPRPHCLRHTTVIVVDYRRTVRIGL